MVRRPRMFGWVRQCQFHQVEKVPDFVVSQARKKLVLLFRRPASLYIEAQHTFTLDLICMQYLCVSDTDYRIFWVPT